MKEGESDEFKTLETTGESLFSDRGSKFHGFACPIRDESAFKKYLENIKSTHYKARHHCYALRVNPRQPYFRANDNGEPAHSAGTPILHAIQSAELFDVGVIVVRYFGGTKLGVPGLIHAYRTAAEEAIRNAKAVVKFVECQIKIDTEYTEMSRVLSLFSRFETRIEEQILEQDCRYLIAVRESQCEALKAELNKLEMTTFTPI